MDEIIFIIEEAPEGGFTAKSLNESIFTEGENLEDLKKNIRNSVICHFEDEEVIPKSIKLHFVREEVIAV